MKFKKNIILLVFIVSSISYIYFNRHSKRKLS